MTIKLPLHKEKVKEEPVVEEPVVEEPSQDGEEKYKVVRVKDKRSVNSNLNQMKDAYGATIAMFKLPGNDAWNIISLSDTMISYTYALLEGEDKLDNTYKLYHIVDKKTNQKVGEKKITYADILTQMRDDWNIAVNQWNKANGWRDAMMRCARINDRLFTIATREGIVNITKEMCNLGNAMNVDEVLIKTEENRQRKALAPDEE